MCPHTPHTCPLAKKKRHPNRCHPSRFSSTGLLAIRKKEVDIRKGLGYLYTLALEGRETSVQYTMHHLGFVVMVDELQAGNEQGVRSQHCALLAMYLLFHPSSACYKKKNAPWYTTTQLDVHTAN